MLPRSRNDACGHFRNRFDQWSSAIYIAQVIFQASAQTWIRSLPAVATVLRLVADHFPVEPIDATLIRSFNNDVYRIDTDAGPYVLKLYGAGRFSTDEVRWEQQLARHLVDAGLPVAADVTLHNGDSVGVLEAPEGERAFALTQWLPGAKPKPPWTVDLYRSVGSTLALCHDAMDSFDSRFPRRAVRIGNEPEQLMAVLDAGSERHRLVQAATTAARLELDRLAERGLRWGIRHGDPSLDNLHVSDDGQLHWYDLDLAGPGWQIEDLTGALSTKFADPFLEGYTQLRSVGSVDLQALPWLGILATIDNLKFHVIDKPALQGTASLSEGWVDRGFESLARAARDVGMARDSSP